MAVLTATVLPAGRPHNEGGGEAERGQRFHGGDGVGVDAEDPVREKRTPFGRRSAAAVAVVL
ncbi:hypothetical protein ACFY3V_33250 [Streptosporangium sp. NPDC000095]|uniref:hypothetical protein n=1 Tax=Streptosporangium sp. NPDC000095 TaxID=3366184 RepID=UPI003697F1A7